MIAYLLCLCTATLITFATPSSTCAAPQYHFEKHLGTKSPYRNVANFNTSEINYRGKLAVALASLDEIFLFMKF